MQSVSVIGLGVMGTELARVLIEKGYAVTVWNRTLEKAAPHVKAGATLAKTPTEAIKASEATITCIRTHSDTRVLLEVDPTALSGKTIIELSTGDASEAASLMAWVANQGADCLIGMIATTTWSGQEGEATGLRKPITSPDNVAIERAHQSRRPRRRRLDCSTGHRFRTRYGGVTVFGATFGAKSRFAGRKR